MADPITPSYIESLADERAVKQRIQQFGARIVPQHSRPSRSVYWSQARGTWIFVARQGSGYKVSYFQMEDCPCNKGA